MADNTDEIHLDNLDNTQSENALDKIKFAKVEQTITSNQEVENMEVHHHPKAEKKNFKEYFLEFMMIFLAVTMGFIAENVRESISNHEKEKHLMEMMMEDLKSDLSKLDSTIKFNNIKLNKLDTFRLLIYASAHNMLPDTSVKKMYYFFRYYGGNVINYSPTQRTLNQLDKNYGFSLIRKQEVSDSIVDYFSAEVGLQNQIESFQNYQIDALHVGESIFNAELLENFKRRESADTFMLSTQNFQLVLQDKQTLFLYGSKLYTARAALLNYIVQLQRQQTRAERLSVLIKQKYNLK